VFYFAKRNKTKQKNQMTFSLKCPISVSTVLVRARARALPFPCCVSLCIYTTCYGKLITRSPDEKCNPLGLHPQSRISAETSKTSLTRADGKKRISARGFLRRERKTFHQRSSTAAAECSLNNRGKIIETEDAIYDRTVAPMRASGKKL